METFEIKRHKLMSLLHHHDVNILNIVVKAYNVLVLNETKQQRTSSLKDKKRQRSNTPPLLMDIIGGWADKKKCGLYLL